MAIYLVLFSALLNILFSFVVIIKSIINLVNLNKYKNMKAKISKEYVKNLEEDQKQQKTGGVSSVKKVTVDHAVAKPANKQSEGKFP